MELTSAPRVTVAIVNWNRADDVLRALRLLMIRPGVSIEVVVVDNGSTDGSLEALRGFEGIRLIELPRNEGPSRARNVAIEAARGEYILFLDSDAVLSRRALMRAVARLDAEPGVALLGFQILNGRTRALDQWIYAEPESDRRREFPTYSFSAAGALARTAVLREVGGFWDNLFIYNEEVDLSIRILRAGHGILYFPGAKVLHLPSVSGRGPSGEYWYYQIRNWIWIYYRYYPRAARVRKVALYLLLYLIKSTRARNLPNCLRGMVEGLRRVDIIRTYGDKLTAADLRRIEALNRRVAIRW